MYSLLNDKTIAGVTFCHIANKNSRFRSAPPLEQRSRFKLVINAKNWPSLTAKKSTIILFRWLT